MLEDGDSRDRILERWEAGWRCLFAAIEPLSGEDLRRTVLIWGEAHSVMEALDRQLAHYAYHVGQIVFLAKHLAGGKWQSLSIPRGRSREIEVAKDGSVYAVAGRKAGTSSPARHDAHRLRRPSSPG